MVLNITEEEEKYDQIIDARVAGFTQIVDDKLRHRLEDLISGEKISITLEFEEGDSQLRRNLTTCQLRENYIKENSGYGISMLEVEDGNYVLTFQKNPTRGEN